MTIRQAKAVLRQIGVTLNKRNGEFRVNLAGGKEKTAYYTDDLEDAYSTGLLMSGNATCPKCGRTYNDRGCYTGE